MRGVIEQIVGVEQKEHGWVTYAIVDGEEVSGWGKTKDHYKVGDKVIYYFDDKYGKPKMALDKLHSVVLELEDENNDK